MTRNKLFSVYLATLAAGALVLDLPPGPHRDAGLVLLAAAWALLSVVAWRMAWPRRRDRTLDDPACTMCGATGVELIEAVGIDGERLVCLPCLYPEGC